MKKLIYYPTFEPTNIEWLKYALVYIDQFSPIIPDSGKSSLSKTFKEIRDNTDLISLNKLEWWQGDNATTKMIKEVDFIERYPELYIDKFNNPNIIRTWKDKRNWEFKLYEEKFSIPFKYYCIENGFAKECDGGIETSKELAMLFMTFLAEEVAFDKGCNPITDLKELDNISTYLRAKNPTNEKQLEAAKAVTQISLPTEMENIDLEKFIEFRKDSGIKELRESFNSSLDSFYNSIENDFNPELYISSLQKTNKDLIKEIGLFFGGLISTTLGGLILVKNPDSLETVKQITEGTILAVTGGLSINTAWKSNEDKRHARKFLSKIQNLNS